MKAWHFVGDTLRGGSPVPAELAMTTHDWARIVARAQEAAMLRRWARYQRRNGGPYSAIRLDAQAARAEQIVKRIAGVT